ncbi:hypothetical protein RMBD60C1_43420 [Escherichia coli]
MSAGSICPSAPYAKSGCASIKARRINQPAVAPFCHRDGIIQRLFNCASILNKSITGPSAFGAEYHG